MRIQASNTIRREPLKINPMTGKILIRKDKGKGIPPSIVVKKKNVMSYDRRRRIDSIAVVIHKEKYILTKFPEHILFFMEMSKFYSGGRYYLWSMAIAMSEAGANVHVVTDCEPIFKNDFIYSKNFSYELNGGKEVRDEIKKQIQFDLVIGTPVNCGVCALRFSVKYKIPLMLVSMESPNYIKEYRVGRDVDESYWVEYRSCLQKADYIITMANLPKKKLFEWIPNLVIKKVFNISPAVNERIIKDINVKEKNAICFISRGVRHKNLEHIISAIAKLKKPPLLNIIGPIDKSVMTIYSKRYPNIKIFLYSNVSDKVKFEILSKSKILVSATNYEGFGLPLVEAFFVKKAVIAYRLPIFEEILGDKIVYVANRNIKDLSDKIAQLLSNNEQRKKLGLEGYEYVKNRYSFQFMVERFKEIFGFHKKIPKVIICMIAINEEQFIEANLKHIYDWDCCHEIIIVEGAVEKYPSQNINLDGSSKDRTVEIIKNFPDPQNKIKLIQGKWKNKEEQRSQYATRVTGDYMFVIDVDEFYTKKDLEILKQEMIDNPNVLQFRFARPLGIVHFWHGLERRVVGGYWDVPHQRIYKYIKGMKYIDNHNHPTLPLPDGRRMDQIKDVGTFIETKVICYHLGFARNFQQVRDKQNFYYNRGEKETRPMYSECREAWFSWKPGMALPHGARVIPYNGPMPEVFEEYADKWFKGEK